MRLVNAKIDDIIRELQFIRKEYGNLPMKDDVTINLDTMPRKANTGTSQPYPSASNTNRSGLFSYPILPRFHSMHANICTHVRNRMRTASTVDGMRDNIASMFALRSSHISMIGVHAPMHPPSRIFPPAHGCFPVHPSAPVFDAVQNGS